MAYRPAHPGIASVPAMVVLLAVVSAAYGLDEAEVLAKLGHEDWLVRQQAWRHLLTDADLTGSQIDSMFSRATNAEQHHRLLDVARHHLLRELGRRQSTRGDQACLGVGLMPINPSQIKGMDQPLSYINTTYPGLPGFVWFVPGDMIMAIDDQRPPARPAGQTHSFFTDRIKAHRPGDMVTITVRRNGKTIDVAVRLADRDALVRLYGEHQNAPAGGTLRPEHRQKWQHRQKELIGLNHGPG